MSVKTNWYPMSTNPVRDGWYEVDCCTWLGRDVKMLHWKDRYWSTFDSPSCSYAVSEEFLRACFAWRGLTEQA